MCCDKWVFISNRDFSKRSMILCYYTTVQMMVFLANCVFSKILIIFKAKNNKKHEFRRGLKFAKNRNHLNHRGNGREQASVFKLAKIFYLIINFKSTLICFKARCMS